ncbi:hypothetical protein TNCV_1213411 [Trichonephila clavipes]|nr:hypothetical protein TNCV_1213411 [Trichonephila clavipes]
MSPKGSLAVRASDPDRKACVGSDARCHQIPECTRSTCSLNQWVRSLVGLFITLAQELENISLPFSSLAEIVEVEIEVVSPSIVLRSFTELKSHCHRMVLKANDRRTLCPCHDESRGPRSDYVRQVALATTTKGCYNTITFDCVSLLANTSAFNRGVSLFSTFQDINIYFGQALLMGSSH